MYDGPFKVHETVEPGPPGLSSWTAFPRWRLATTFLGSPPFGRSAGENARGNPRIQMSVKIRLKRMGRKKAPHYRVVVTDTRSPRDGRFVETLGYYKPVSDPARLVLDLERVDYWIGQGAQPSGTVKSLIGRARNGGDDTVAIGEVDSEERKKQAAEALAAKRAAEAAAAAEAEAAAKAEAEAAAAAEAEAAAAAEAEAAEEEAAGDEGDESPAAEADDAAADEADPESEASDEDAEKTE